MDYLGISSFFILGLMGGFGHCTGMCNPFVVYVASRFTTNKDRSQFQKFIPHVFYNLGRVITYISLGLLFGVLGKISSDFSNIQGFAGLVAGSFLIVYGVVGLFGGLLRKSIESLSFIKVILNVVAKIQPGHPFWVGIILGFLPCGLVYSALAGAMALGHPLAGGLAMGLFGAGTTIAMLTIAILGNIIASKRGILNTVSMIFLIGMGAYFIINTL